MLHKSYRQLDSEGSNDFRHGSRQLVVNQSINNRSPDHYRCGPGGRGLVWCSGGTCKVVMVGNGKVCTCRVSCTIIIDLVN